MFRSSSAIHPVSAQVCPVCTTDSRAPLATGGTAGVEVTVDGGELVNASGSGGTDTTTDSLGAAGVDEGDVDGLVEPGTGITDAAAVAPDAAGECWSRFR